jgi:Thiamine pyrophosphate enzyme, N-terminal TPP binding domain
MGANITTESSSDLRMSGGKIVLQALRDNGVRHIFGYPGAAVLPIYDELFRQEDIRHILCRHEQGVGHAAEGYARSSGKVGVMIVTSGPGVTNAITPLQNALADSTPIVCLSGQVPTHLIGSDAFQECDTVGITRSCTKHNWLVTDTDKLAETIHEAFRIAKSGRPGPVLVDMPKDVLVSTGRYAPPSALAHDTFPPPPDVRSFPAEPPLLRRLAELAGWWLDMKCQCADTVHLVPLRRLAVQHGWQTPLSAALPKLRCDICNSEPMSVELIEDVAGAAMMKDGKPPCARVRLI